MPRKGAYKIVRFWGKPLQEALVTHVDGLKTTSKGHISQVHHVQMGWIPIRQYYLMQKAHDTLPLIQEAIKGGYLLNAAVYSFSPSVEVAGISAPIPAGPALLGVAILELVGSLNAGNVPVFLKALYKVAGPFGALVQIVESIQGALGLVDNTAGSWIQALTDTVQPAGGEDPCAPTTLRLLIESLTPGGHVLRAVREEACREKQGLTP